MNTNNQSQAAIDYLRDLQPGFLPRDIFAQITRLVVTPIIEVVPLRKVGDSVEILLLKRPASDPNWANMLHTPGTVLRADDEKGGLASAFARILQDELKGVETIGTPTFVGFEFHQVARGSELALIHWIEVKDNNGVGTFCNSETLPDGIVNTQRDFIAKAVAHFSTHSF